MGGHNGLIHRHQAQHMPKALKAEDHDWSAPWGWDSWDFSEGEHSEVQWELLTFLLFFPINPFLVSEVPLALLKQLKLCLSSSQFPKSLFCQKILKLKVHCSK